jgi:leukotriene-A4 hydrolase
MLSLPRKTDGVVDMITEDPHSFADFSQGRIKHIDFEIEVDFTTRTMKVLAHYHLDHPVTGSFFLDTRAVEIERVSQEGRDIPWVLDKQDEIIGERLHLQDLVQADHFSIQLTTSPAASALQWLMPKQTAGGMHPFVYSQCQAIHARSIFPCQDTPSIRFTYTANVRVPHPLKAVMGAEQVDQVESGESIVTSFRMLQPIPSYLFALAAGELAFRELGPRTGIYAEPEVIDAAAWEFAENEQKLKEAEKLLGPYLWDRYDVLILPPSFPFGGMENPRLTFLSPTTIVGDRSLTNIITHELAHAWTGNLVTNATWEDFWINEGWTTYAEWRITEVLEGSDIEQLIRYINGIYLRKLLARLGRDSNLTCLKTSSKDIDPDESGMLVAYVKGADFLFSIENAVGREKFDGFVKRYIEAYQFKSITTEAFLSFLQKELPEASKQVDFEEWVYQPGYPESAPVLHSQLYDEVAQAVDAYRAGARPDAGSVGSWSGRQVFQFLFMLEDQKISLEDCQYFEALFGLEESSAVDILTAFYLSAIPAGYREIRPGIERYVKTIGREFYLTQLFRCMVKTDWTREFARSLFEENRARHHPITVKTINAILTKAGL